MASNTTYLITGANRGLGLGLTRSLLLRPNTTVIATIRSIETLTTDLNTLATSPGSKLLISPYTLSLSSTETAAKPLLDTLAANKITEVNILVLNAGLGSSFKPIISTSLADLTTHFEANTLLPITMFQTLFPLLSFNAKVILISSSLGSIGEMEGMAPTLAYGISKAGANYFVRMVHFEHERIVAVALHPGWLKTRNGQNFADSIGVKEPPMALEESVEGVLAQIDLATKETTSGTFISYDGNPIQW